MYRLLAVDGSNLLFQMFYGMPARILSPDGYPIQGTLGFVGALLRMIRMTQPTHVAVVFDGEGGSFRTELSSEYKADREDYSKMAPEDTPFGQLPYIYAALDLLGIVHRETEHCEADDWLASIALSCPAEHEVILASQDSDLFQLISNRVRILRYRGQKSLLCDRTYLMEKLGVEPEQYAAFKALTGDTSDNIRGLDMIGPKTAASLLARFGSLESILSHAQLIDRPSVRRSVCAQGERALLNYRLIRLSGAEEMPFSWEQMVFSDPGMTTSEVLRRIGIK